MPTKKTTTTEEKAVKKPAVKKAAAPKAKAAKAEVITMKAAPTQEQVRELATKLWEERGRPFGSPEVDWTRAEELLKAA